MSDSSRREDEPLLQPADVDVIATMARQAAREESERVVGQLNAGQQIIDPSQKKDTFVDMGLDTKTRIMAELVGWAAAAISIRLGAPQEVVAAGYGVIQTGRAAVHTWGNPMIDDAVSGDGRWMDNGDGSKSVKTRTPLGVAVHTIQRDEISNDQFGMNGPKAERRKRYAVKTVLAVAATGSLFFSSWNGQTTAADSEDTTAVEEAPEVAESPTDFVLDTSCVAGDSVLRTPIPYTGEQALSEPEQSLYEESVEEVQRVLAALGYYDPNDIDGFAGPVTQKSIYNLKLVLAQEYEIFLTDTPSLTTEDCLMLQELGLWQPWLQLADERIAAR